MPRPDARINEELELAVTLAAELTHADPGSSSAPFYLLALITISLLTCWAALCAVGVTAIKRRLGGWYSTVPSSELPPTAKDDLITAALSSRLPGSMASLSSRLPESVGDAYADAIARTNAAYAKGTEDTLGYRAGTNFASAGGRVSGIGSSNMNMNMSGMVSDSFSGSVDSIGAPPARAGGALEELLRHAKQPDLLRPASSALNDGCYCGARAAHGAAYGTVEQGELPSGHPSVEYIESESEDEDGGAGGGGLGGVMGGGMLISGMGGVMGGGMTQSCCSSGGATLYREATLYRIPGESLGFDIQLEEEERARWVITSISVGSVAERSGQLQVGDMLWSINGQLLQPNDRPAEMMTEEVWKVRLGILRRPHHPRAR